MALEDFERGRDVRIGPQLIKPPRTCVRRQALPEGAAAERGRREEEGVASRVEDTDRPCVNYYRVVVVRVYVWRRQDKHAVPRLCSTAKASLNFACLLTFRLSCLSFKFSRNASHVSNSSPIYTHVVVPIWLRTNTSSLNIYNYITKCIKKRGGII